MRVPALGEAATQLPWLSPCAASLLALVRSSSASAWAAVRYDPGAVLLIVRQTAHVTLSPALSVFPAVLRDPAILEGAVRLLNGSALSRECSTVISNGGPAPPAGPPLVQRSHLAPHSSGFVNFENTAIFPIYRASLLYARSAMRLAELSGRCDADNAWIAGLIAALGWLAVCAIDPEQASSCLRDRHLADDSVSTQQRYWGYDQGAIARRLLWRWQVPRWLAVVVGHLGLPVGIAQGLGADPDLFQVVQAAVGLAQQHGPGLHLSVGATFEQAASALGLPARDQEALVQEIPRFSESPGPLQNWKAPDTIALLPELLALAAQNQQLRDAPTLEQLQRDQDQLHQALENQRTGETERLRELKLTALAEFAAGAAHEINNPLAVISGQAQYLLGRESEAPRQRALQTIIGQARRVHQVLTEVMQFARPSKAQKQLIDIRSLLREVMLTLGDLAQEKQVRLVCADPDQALNPNLDPRHIGTALECLLRNAIEAASGGGWASLRVEIPAADRLELIVEDSGAGPPSAQREHLFDPFYSGRHAGRGRGLGLPTAWRLARENGGDVQFVHLPGGPTRFVLSLPLESSENGQAKAPGTSSAVPRELENGHSASTPTPPSPATS